MREFDEQYCPVCGSPVVAVIIEEEPVELKKDTSFTSTPTRESYTKSERVRLCSGRTGF